MESKKKLGLGSGISICMGLIVATSCLVSLGQGVGLSGHWFTVSLIIVAILNAFVALSFAEMNRIMPNVTGGLGQYMLVGLGPWASIVSNMSAYVIMNFFALSVELAMCGIVLNALIPAIPVAVFSVVILAILFILNLYGVDIFAKVQSAAVFLLIGSMIVLGICGSLKLGTGTPIDAAQQAPEMTGFGNAVSLSALAFWLFIGVEFIVPYSKDLRNPRRNVPLSMILALLVLLVVQSVLGNGIYNYVSTEELMSSDMPHIVYAEKLFGRAGTIWISIVSLLATVSTINTLVPTVGKIPQGMAEERMMPRFFGKTNKRGAAWPGMILVAVVNVILVVSGAVNSSGLINMLLAGSCFWLASYILTHINVLILRKRYPHAQRSRALMLGGIPQIIGIIGNIYMLWNISSDMESRIMIYEVFGIIFVILALFAFSWVRLVMKTRPFSPTYIGRMNIDKSIEVKTSL